MKKKGFTSEQTITMLREAKVLPSRQQNCRGTPFGMVSCRGDRDLRVVESQIFAFWSVLFAYESIFPFPWFWLSF